MVLLELQSGPQRPSNNGTDPTKQIAMDGTTGTIKAGDKITIDGNKGTIKAGDKVGNRWR